MPFVTKVTSTLALLGLLTGAAASSAFAQDAGGAEMGTAPAAELGGLSLGEDPTDEPQPGQVYIREEAGDWAVQCIKSETGEDEPCQLYQLLEDEDQNPVAEIIVFKVSNSAPAVAGASIIAPLETLLTTGLLLSVDGGPVKKYPFSVCNRVGCVARIGLTQPELDAFKAGSAGEVTIRPFSAPDVEVNLNVSLTGFTAGFDMTTDIPDGAQN